MFHAYGHPFSFGWSSLNLRKLCTKVTILNDFGSRWNGDICLFFSNKVMFLYRYFLSSLHMQNMYMKHTCMLYSLNDRHALLIIVCYNNRIMIIIFSCNLSIQKLQPLQCYTCTYCVAVILKSVSCIMDTILYRVLYFLFCKIPSLCF